MENGYLTTEGEGILLLRGDEATSIHLVEALNYCFKGQIYRMNHRSARSVLKPLTCAL